MVLTPSKVKGGSLTILHWLQVLTHLVNLLGHFPFACGTAQMSSVVSEFHDCPSLQHLDELSMEIFDSPRVQVRCVCMFVVFWGWGLMSTAFQ